ncbi:MAG: DUF4129 domain-containing protein [Chloroflexota bacterium]
MAQLPSRNLLQPLLIAALSTALLVGPVTLVQMLAPGERWGYLVILIFIVALEGVATTFWLGRIPTWQVRRLTYRAAEFLVIALGLRLATWAMSGDWPSLADWRGYLLAPLAFIDATFFIYLVLAGLAWERAITVSDVLARLPIQPAEIAYYTRPGSLRLNSDDRPPIPDRPELLASFFKTWIYGAMLLALCAALSTFELRPLAMGEVINLRTIGRLGLPPDLLVALLLYFLAGFWLLSQARLALLRARWLADGAATAPDVAGRWQRTSLLILLGAALVASFLPIGSTLALSRVIQALMVVLISLVNLFLALVVFLFYLVYAWLIGEPAADRSTSPPLSLTLPQFQPPAVPSSPDLAFLSGVVFWMVAVLVTLYAVYFFLSRRGLQIDGRPAQQFWPTLVAWLHLLWQRIHGRVSQISQLWPPRRQPLPASTQPLPPHPFIRLNALTPRDQIRYFYLSTARRAAAKGVARRPAATPLEYARDLTENWPEAAVDLDSLTNAFVEARYTPRPVTSEYVPAIKRIWQRVKAAVRRRPVASGR